MNSPSRKKRILLKKFIDRINRGGHLVMAFYFAVFNMIPQNSFALTGGPSQPEVQSFEPIGTSEMVDLFSGDFVYNLPLLDVGGYPLNLSYHSGITTDQEASWVGLGWNVNPGTINRGMRGIPDDFDGDLIHHELNTKPNTTVGLNAGVSIELLGLPDDAIGFGVNVGLSMGINYNTYKGVAMESSVDVSASVGSKNAGSLTSGLGLSSSSDGGLTVQPSLSLSAKMGSEGQTTLGASVGTAINSRTGLQQLSINTSLSVNTENSEIQDSKGKNAKASTTGEGLGGSFNLGQPTFSPQVGMQMQTFSMSGRFKGGGELFGADVGFHLSGYFNEQDLTANGKSWDNPAYGYFNSEKGQSGESSTLDFNREKDGGFTETTPGLPVTNFTYDLFSVTGQGVGGSYRSFRSDIGYVFDSKSKSTSSSKSLSVEISPGNTVHAGGNITVVNSNQNSGKWDSKGNNASRVLKYNKKNQPYEGFEPYYLKEANEKSVSSDPSFFENFGGNKPVRFELNKTTKFNTKLEPKLIDKDGNSLSINSNYRKKREKRNQVLTFLNRKQLEMGLGILPHDPNSFDAPDHHIAEITTLNTSGERYVYGLAAYNLTQEDVTFAVGSELNQNNALVGDYKTGLVTYTPGVDDSRNNKRGIDHYYSKNVTPAYAHSYLLTCILSSDYVDSDGLKGPTDGDLGTYTKFEYKKQALYKWRVPFGKNQANYSDGLKSDAYDDKASYVYGEKEIWYLDKVITKNHIAVFTLENRTDAHSVLDNKGEINPSPIMQRIKKISLYSKKDYQNSATNAIPVKEVHFEYDYLLCKKLPNSTEPIGEKGKLTLTKVYFTYQNSSRGALSKYKFSYGSGVRNPDYNMKSYDRWGNYKLNDVNSLYTNLSNKLPAAEFPYTNQNQGTQDDNAAAWNLNKIELPSGGVIEVEYESDDYAYVQHKKAKQMIKIVGTSNIADASNQTTPIPTPTGNVGDNTLVSNFSLGGSDLNNYLIVERPSSDYTPEDLTSVGDQIYFRCLVNTLPNSATGPNPNPRKYDYVSGYGEVESMGVTSDPSFFYIRLKGASLEGGANANYNPITMAAIQFGRLYLPKYVWNTTGISEPMKFGKQILKSFMQVMQNFVTGFGNQNKLLWRAGVGNYIINGKSWLKMDVKNKKLGGGARVKKVTISDEWSLLTGTPGTSGAPSALYGQEYDYTLDGEVSSGVAAYEPQLGGDENPWRIPVFYDKELLLAPDERMYQELPYGESFFPSASVGYSRVAVKNITPQNATVTRHGTGKVVNTFYTAKDFPTIPQRTKVESERNKTDPMSITSFFKIASRDFMTATQGFSIELNDMHGKPKGTYVYAEGVDGPISTKEYFFKSESYLGSSRRLVNDATVVSASGNVKQAKIGVMFDMVADFRRQTSFTASTTVNANFDMFFLGVFPIPIPIVFGSYSEDVVQFHSATTTKVIQRFGLLDRTVITDVGSSITTKTIAYDSETGNELISETTNNFDDPIYNMNFPAYWYYENMGQAYKNIGFETPNGLNFTNGVANYANANKYFFKGDELEVLDSQGNSLGTRIWVLNVNQNSFKAIKKDGNKYNGTNQIVRVLRSGRKNMMDGQMASLTSYSNPLNSIKDNVYNKVVQASAIEFSDQWRTYCDCSDDGFGTLTTTNPFILGTEGFYKPKATYSYLTERTQNLVQDNLDIRNDGIYESFTPFYRVTSSNKWKKDYRNWTFTEMITEFNPNGGQLESKDALNRYSAETYGYHNSVVTASAGNARYREVGFDGFEDHNYDECSDTHFRFIGTLSNESHTGNKSLQVENGDNVTLTKDIALCDLSDCNLSVESFIDNADIIHLKVLNGVAPIDVQWTILSGNPIVLPSPNASYIVQIKSSGTFRIKFEFTDKNGCQVSTVYKSTI